MQNTSPTPKAGAVRGSEKKQKYKILPGEYLTICQNRNLSPSTIKGYENACLHCQHCINFMYQNWHLSTQKLDRQQKNKTENDPQ